jgi:hypothetical protein
MEHVHRTVITRLLVSGVVIGVVVFVIGAYIAARDAGCDAGCPSDSAVAAARVLIPAGGALFAVTTVGLSAWLLRLHRHRRADRPRKHEPSLREW